MEKWNSPQYFTDNPSKQVFVHNATILKCVIFVTKRDGTESHDFLDENVSFIHPIILIFIEITFIHSESKKEQNVPNSNEE